MLSWAGSVYLSSYGLTLPGSTHFPVFVSLVGAELNGSHTRIDAEGRILGERPGTTWMLINAGFSAGSAKVADDSIQLIIEAIVSGATDASTAGMSRIVSASASGILLVTQHGRDVVLPRFTEMEVVLNRPLSLTSAQD